MMMMCGGDNATTHHGLLLVMKTTPSYIVGIAAELQFHSSQHSLPLLS